MIVIKQVLKSRKSESQREMRARKMPCTLAGFENEVSKPTIRECERPLEAAKKKKKSDSPTGPCKKNQKPANSFILAQ